MAAKLFVDRSFTTRLFLFLSGKQQPDISAELLTDIAAIYDVILYDASGVSAIEGSVNSADIVRNKMTPVPYEIGNRAQGIATQIRQVIGPEMLSDFDFIQKAQHYNLKKGGIPRPHEEILGYLADIVSKSTELGGDLLIDPAREELVDTFLRKICSEATAPSDTKRLRRRSYQGVLASHPALANALRSHQLSTVSVLPETTTATERKETVAPGSPFVFISYSRSDTALVEKVARALKGRGVAVWNDQRLRIGGAYADEIRQKINESKCVIVIWSVQASQSHWVRDEADLAKEQNKLVPILTDGTLPPLGFREIHALNLTNWNGQDSDPRFAELVDIVNGFVAGEDSGP